MSDVAAAHAEMLGNRVRKNLRHRRRWAVRVPTDAWRLYDHDIPEVPIVVDVYGPHLHLADARLDTEVEAQGADWLDAMVAAVCGATDVPEERIHVKTRERQRGAAQYQPRGAGGAVVVVNEQGLRFEVNLDDYLDTGLFLDHRPLRATVRAEAEGTRFLNLFAYTGSFTVYAAAGGARALTTTDLSATYLDWGRRNLRLNGLEDDRDERVRADTFDFLRDAAATGRTWDRVVLDPPTFSNSKRMVGTFDVQRDHTSLLELAGRVLAPAGRLWFSTNRRKFSLRIPAELHATDITDATIPEDFRQRRPHRAWLIEHARR